MENIGPSPFVIGRVCYIGKSPFVILENHHLLLENMENIGPCFILKSYINNRRVCLLFRVDEKRIMIQWTHTAKPCACCSTPRQARRDQPGYGKLLTNHMAIWSYDCGPGWCSAKAGRNWKKSWGCMLNHRVVSFYILFTIWLWLT